MQQLPYLPRWIKTLLASALIIILLLAGVSWLSNRESTLQWIAQKIAQASGGQVTLQGLEGTIYGNFKIAKLIYENETVIIELHELNLDWSAWGVLRKHIKIDHIDIEQVVVNLKSNQKRQPELPAVLMASFSFDIKSVGIDSFTLIQDNENYRAEKIKFKLSYLDEVYRFIMSEAHTEWGDVKSNMTLNARPPFLSSADLSLSGEAQQSYTVHAQLSGKLSELNLTALAKAGGSNLQADAILALFESEKIKKITGEAKNINLSQWAKNLPHTDIHLKLNADGIGDQANGMLQAQNNIPGSIDQKKLPLKGVQALYTGNLDQFRFSNIFLDMGGAGKFSGTGEFKAKRLTLKFTTGNFNLKGIHSQLKQTKMAGRIDLMLDDEGQHIDASLLSNPFQVKLAMTRDKQQILLRHANIKAVNGELNLLGTLNLSAEKRFSGHGVLKNFNPAQWGRYFQASINGSFEVDGKLAHDWQVATTFLIEHSSLRNQKLSGKGKISFSETRVWGADAWLRVADNYFSTAGSFGGIADRLNWQIVAKNLAHIDPSIAGDVNATGSLEGTFGEPAFAFSLSANNLKWKESVRIEKINGQGNLGQGAAGKMAMNAVLKGLHSSSFNLNTAEVVLNGTRTLHTVAIQAKGTAIDFISELTGGWQKTGWSGVARRLENRGSFSLNLTSQVGINFGKDYFDLTGASIAVPNGGLFVRDLHWDPNGWHTDGELSGFPIEYFRPLFVNAPVSKSTLKLNGKWEITADHHLNGRLELRRDQGDIFLMNHPQLPLGITNLNLSVQSVQNRLTLKLDLEGNNLGRISLNAETLTERRGKKWGISGAAPLHMNLYADVPSLASVAPLFDQNYAVDGTLKVQLAVKGNVGDPHLDGTILGERLSLRSFEYGIDLKEGRLNAVLNEDTLSLKEFVFFAGSGSFRADGTASLKQDSPLFQIKWRADHLNLFSKPDRHLIVSGIGSASLRNKQIHFNGILEADEGIIELPKIAQPKLSEDVVIVGKTSVPAQNRPKHVTPFLVKLNFELDLGEQFYFRGRGIDAQLGGVLRVSTTSNKQLIANGSINVIQGSYTAYGQQLSIEKGILNFSGPIDNPSLNILAMRKNQAVEAGVAVTGTALSPQIKLVSNPQVPDNEKLAWLILGRGLQEANKVDLNVLQAATTALLAKGDSITFQRRVAQATGLDEISFSGSGELQDKVVTLGKRISSQVYLTFERSLLGTSNLAAIHYDLSKNWSLRAQTGTDSAIDLFYTISFD